MVTLQFLSVTFIVLLAHIYCSVVLLRFMVRIRETVCALLAVITVVEYPCLARFFHYNHVSLLSHYEINRGKFVKFLLSLLSHSLITVT